MKERLDILLVERELAASREKAKALIMSGIVYVDGQKEDKAGSSFSTDAEIEVRGNRPKYVSRGGLKLEKALKAFHICLDGKTCMDVGASTGGFTDCMLKNGAARVYAIDVGHGQLDWGLRQDPRVVCMEKTNIRYLTAEEVPEKMSFVSIDVSFISLSKVFPAVQGILKTDGEVAALIKPQFEAGREKVGKHGVVRDPLVHIDVIRNAIRSAKENQFVAHALTYSPIRGPEGNIEYLCHFVRPARDAEDRENGWDFIREDRIEAVVTEAHAVLSQKKERL